MKKYYISLAVILLSIALHAQAYAGEGDKEMDMSIYASWAAYGFLILLALAVAFFLPRLAINSEKERQIAPIAVINQGMASPAVMDDVLPQLRVVYYSVISLIVLQISIFLLLIIF